MLFSSMKILLIVAFLAAVNSQSDDNEDEGSRSQINSAALAEESKATQGATLVRPDTKANCNWKEPGYYKECFPAPDWTHPDPNVIQIIPTEFTDVWWWYSTLWRTIDAAEYNRDRSAMSALANLPKKYVRWTKKYSRQDLNRMAKKPIRDQLYPEFCTTRCTNLKPWHRISKCFETHFKEYGYNPKKYMYCPDWYKKWNLNDVCKEKPWMCYVPMPPFKGPKCCECIHCRYYWHQKDITSADAQTQEFERTQDGEPQPALGGSGGDSGAGSQRPPEGGSGSPPPP